MRKAMKSWWNELFGENIGGRIEPSNPWPRETIPFGYISPKIMTTDEFAKLFKQAMKEGKLR